MAISWGSTSASTGKAVTGNSGGVPYTPAKVSSSGGKVLGANTSASTAKRSSGTPTPAPTPVQEQSQDYGSMVDLGGMPDTDSIFAPQDQYLAQAEAQLRADLPTYQKEAETNFNANKGQLDTNKNSTLADITGQLTTGDRKYEDAATAARRLFNEQQMGVNQRFGGASSAGEAGRAVLGQAMQQQLGANQRSAVDFHSQIARQQQSVNDSYNSNLLGLEQQKQSALAAIQRDFQSKLLEIANNRAQLASAKAQARVQALMDLRNKTFAVQMQNMQFKQALDAQKQQATASLGQYTQQLGGARTGAASALQGFNPSQGTALNAEYGNNNATTNPYVGQIGYQPKKEEQLIYNSSGNVMGGRSLATPYQY